ncbi:G2/M phase-specific E3 ubiquitin-protein ligase isoform X1 [Synchiropus splendidus]|uniref:G2/M phase-specific E3 ubiquitin-protein ligase isoform X1 n=2 Tax=Synchiropus splendidus TaxID=270530 RepID=UPI00237D7A43|nr:G2/M phase-specific E3 ubiquitin-protein ligase isoform X1 [Synchiropus splendidus]XP_053700467.1 G2/M phase-specific E3 ubiquitin-protein ligase isoform X1 [Synchiropus splendidus]XP_053700468.1 G2/M phase-specific E3 ubiquitin-protein ligase isoform X1 [Synchiropus splendidus]
MRTKAASQLAGMENCCVLCRLPDDDPNLFGEKFTVTEENISVHYFCLLTSSGVYQRGKEHEGIVGFMVDDIKMEVRRSSRLKCVVCKKTGASVGCNIRSCRKMVHFPCGRSHRFLSQFTGLFPSFCPDHSPTQTMSVTSELSLPQTCSVCLDSLDPVLSYSVLKCPSCHGSWFHRDCVQHQALSAGLFFFKCTLCNNKKEYQEEMLRMGIYIPERDASWELEANAYSELLQVYSNCDAETCVCRSGRSHSAKTGWFHVVRCLLCGSTGTHRKCSGLSLDTQDWACSDCSKATDGQASLMASPQGQSRVSLLTKRRLSSSHSPVTSKRAALPSPAPSPRSYKEVLQALAVQLLSDQEAETWSEVLVESSALNAGLDLVRRQGFDPTHPLSVRFRDEARTSFPSSPWLRVAARQRFLEQLVGQIQNSAVFEGPEGCKSLRLDSRALADDLYFDVGCLLALALVHGGPPLGFFSSALFQCLFNYPPNCPLSLSHMTPGTAFTKIVARMMKADSVQQLQRVQKESVLYLELAGCNRPVMTLEDRDVLVEDLVSFTLITRMQLPLQRLREGLQTLGVFQKVQLFPSWFYGVFCNSSLQLSVDTLNRLFHASFSAQTELHKQEEVVHEFWRCFLLDCEVGRSSVTLQDVLQFSTGTEVLPAIGLLPVPRISFLDPASCSSSSSSSDGDQREQGLFPQCLPGSNHLQLPLTTSYRAFKSAMEQAVSHRVHFLPSDM